MVVFFILAFGGMFIMIKDEEACNHKVELKDGTIYDAKTTNSYDNGLTYIHLCEGGKLEIPTIDVKFIKRVEDAD